MIDSTAGLRWLTTKRAEAFRDREAGEPLHNNGPERWQAAIDILRPRSFPVQVADAERDSLPYAIGVHMGHCCADHGCKYGDEDCPVAGLRIVQQSYPCEQCGERQEHIDATMQGVEDEAASLYPWSDESIQDAIARRQRAAFIAGARWAASKGA